MLEDGEDEPGVDGAANHEAGAQNADEDGSGHQFARPTQRSFVFERS